jgi:proteasome assembly chaperone 2
MPKCCLSCSYYCIDVVHICFRNSTYYIHPPNTPPLVSHPLSSLSQLPIPEYTSPVMQHTQSSADEGAIPFIPGGGLTRRFLSSMSVSEPSEKPSTWSIPTAALLQFVVEGDNRADANLFAVVVAKVLAADTLIREWRQPTSWTQGLFGTAHDQSLYG